MRGTKCNLTIEQGEKEGFKPKLYIKATTNGDIKEFVGSLYNAVDGLTAKYPGISVEKIDDTTWTLVIPNEYNVGHEAHFTQVTEKYLQYLIDGKLPEWEVPNMIVKYYTTTEGLKAALK
jgi:hypothetical protein